MTHCPPKRAQARRMRSNPTSSEAMLWRLLRDRHLGGLKFRRQVPLGRYIADFVCFRHRLIVEADGPFHQDDSVRDAWLVGEGFRVLRFSNALIETQPREVLDAVVAAIAVPEASPWDREHEGFHRALTG